ncbi:MAG: sulfotransferase [Proteobacteria bacterium]|nr:sulfotransferase [Pseudomonadota bacterium]
MQKSGTSLLNRLLMYQPFITNPFLPEGKFFWGDDPPFSPKAAPCGHLYQKHLGQHGHALDAKDFDYSDQTLLNHRITEAKVSTPILVNKNPYNSVRIPWLKRMFPDCKIVTITRKPQANIYSLLKKYQTHKGLGVEPEDGWWGIKPLNWQELLNNDKLIQCANQWTAINEQLYENIHQIDYLLSYSSLCNNP